MISLRDMEFLAALARRKHFARAAEDCGVSQPAFSMRIRNIEDRLGTTIVRRGNRFLGFTKEGDTLVRHARKMMDGLKVMEQEFRSARGEITGQLAIGVIPTAVIYAARAVRRLREAHPGITVGIHTATSLAIQQGLDSSRFDAGFTYGEGIPRDLLRADDLYLETYHLLMPRDMAPRRDGTVSWEEAAQLPLSLLEPEMQNRRIIDKVFGDLGLVPDVVADTSGFIASMVLAAEGTAATIVPELLVETMVGLEQTVALPLVDPTLEKDVSLVTPLRDQSLPAVAALRQACLNES